MQQRYYDPRVGRFWSVDPVTAYSDPVGQFNRYRYANNNPYRFTDPDGRMIRRPWGDPWRGGNLSGPFRSTNPLNDCRFCLGGDGSSQASSHSRKKSGGSDHGSLTGALADDASEVASDRGAWVNAGKELLEGGAETLFEPFKIGAEFAECAAICTFDEFIGENPVDMAGNAYEEATIRGFERGFEEAGMSKEAGRVRTIGKVKGWWSAGAALHCALIRGCDESE